MIRAFSAVVLLSAIADPAWADWEYTRWGMTAQQVIAASDGAAHAMPADRRYRSDADHYEISVEAKTKRPPPGAVGFQFELPGGGLQCVITNATGDYADILRSDLIQRFGPPLEESSFGPTSMLRWSTPDRVELTMNSSPKAAMVSHCAPGKS